MIGKFDRVASITAIIISVLAVVLAFSTSYKSVLRAFELSIRIDPQISVQHRGNFGTYVNIDFTNMSPSYGIITQVCLILYKSSSIEDKYLLALAGFRVLNSEGVYVDSEERLPLVFEPWQRVSKTMSFIYLTTDEQFPFSEGTWNCELLIWTDDAQRATYVKQFKFEITADVSKVYMERKLRGSTTLEPLNIVGYTPLKSKKLSNDDYKGLR